MYSASSFCAGKLEWNGHGLKILAAPENATLLDIMIHVDDHPHPGTKAEFSESRKYHAGSIKNFSYMGTGYSAKFSRAKLLSLCKAASKPTTAVMAQLKALGILRYRGRLGARNTNSARPINIKVVERGTRSSLDYRTHVVSVRAILLAYLESKQDPRKKSRILLSQNVFLLTSVICLKQRIE